MASGHASRYVLIFLIFYSFKQSYNVKSTVLAQEFILVNNPNSFYLENELKVYTFKQLPTTNHSSNSVSSCLSTLKHFIYLISLIKRLLITELICSSILLSCGDIQSNPGPGEAISYSHFATKKGIVLAHINVRGLRSSLDGLKILTSKNPIDVLTVSETWLNSNIPNQEIDLTGYNLIRKDRINGRGGGVAAFIKSKYAYVHRSDLELDGVEATWFELKLPHTKPILLASVYSPPKDDQFFDKFKNIVDHIQIGSEVVVLGDLNCNMLGRSQ